GLREGRSTPARMQTPDELSSGVRLPGPRRSARARAARGGTPCQRDGGPPARGLAAGAAPKAKRRTSAVSNQISGSHLSPTTAPPRHDPRIPFTGTRLMHPAAGLDLLAQDAGTLSRRIAAREVSCREVMEASLARIAALNPVHNAI